MGHFVWMLCALLLCASIWQLIAAEVTRDEESLDLYSKRKSNTALLRSHIGRRKRSPGSDSEDFYKTVRTDKEQFNSFISLLQDRPWAIVAVNEGKRHTPVNFTPRLGRESGEEYVSMGSGRMGLEKERFFQEPDAVADMAQRSPPFAPRLGRKAQLQLVPFSPRLGRDPERVL